jgi:hypothetical protein
MLKSLVAASALALFAVTGFGGTAQADGWTCPMPIMKGGCSVLVRQPDQPLPKP